MATIKPEIERLMAWTERKRIDLEDLPETDIQAVEDWYHRMIKAIEKSLDRQ